MRVLVTRTEAASQALAEKLRERGHEAVVAPLFSIAEEPEAEERLARALDGAQAVLFTSAAGARAFAALNPRRDLPALCVGDATAEAARAAGFVAVESARGNVESLARLVIARLQPGKGPLVHASAKQIAGDLGASLAPWGFKLRRAVLYRARPAAALTPDSVAAIRGGHVDAALFFSPRASLTFVRLARAAGVAAECGRLAAVALSAAVAAPLGAFPWRAVITAQEPTEASLLQALDRLAPERSATPSAGIEGC
ncbi:MAG TPA: uroporphyrinogen-III synthase [Stellaceae bacterium]|nr:uroporphyrinogen-III synthase [Stellaceae bacterium]